MNLANARRLAHDLPADAVVVDVGGGASPFPRADYIIDAIPFEQQAALGWLDLDIKPRFRKETWHQTDLCEHKPWPFADKFFDFATCSHLLEDVRDPVWICSELVRVAKAGYIEFPSRILEQTLGVEHPSYTGYYHHRWLITVENGGLEFRHKPHLLHSANDAIVTSVGVRRKLNPKYEITVLEWKGAFDFREVHEFNEEKAVAELCEFARSARRLPELTVDVGRPLLDRIKRAVYFRRLKRGLRS